MSLTVALIIITAVLAAVFFGFAFAVYSVVFARVKKWERPPHYMSKSVRNSSFKDAVYADIEYVMNKDCEDVYIKAQDGISLYGRYYEIKKGAPVILFFHGFRSGSFREGCGIFRLAEKLSYNVLMPDQRGHGKSGGRKITLGVLERYDCVKWLEYLNERFPNASVFLAGVSMGATTVLMASELIDGKNVKGIVGDCGYTSPCEEIRQVMKNKKIPAPLYFFAKLSARIYGGFSIEKCSATESLKHTRIPVLFIHGDEDRFVPLEMTEKNYKACASEKELCVISGARHSKCYYVDTEKYEKAVTEFFNKHL